MTPIERLIRDHELRAAEIIGQSQRIIALLARAAFAKMWKALTEQPDLPPRDAIIAAQVEFSGSFADALTKAFGELLQASIGIADVRALPVSGLTLSRRLYLHNVQTAAEVARVIQQHATGAAQARTLALALYDGYNPADGIKRPLEGRARATLPQALRAITEDPSVRRDLNALMVRGQQQAARIKSPALKAAYLETLDAWQTGAGQEALRRKLQVAQAEKNRYFADRIATTELHRASQTQAARDLMDDEQTTVVQVKVSPSHPRRDICDLFAEADLWNLGPGNYPKEQAPVPPFHPWCRCKLRSRPSLFVGLAKPVPGGDAAFLRRLTPKQQAQVMGSEARAQQVLAGADAVSVFDAGKDEAYRTLKLGDRAAREYPLVTKESA